MRREQGMTLVEVMVAMFVLTAGIVGAFGAFDGLLRLGGITEKKQLASRYAEQEIEHLRSLGWPSLQLSSTPAAMSDSRGTVAGGTYSPPNGSNAENLVVATSCPTSASCVDPGPTAWSAGNASGYVYRFITAADDTACGAPCTATVDRLRITVALTVSEPHNPLKAIVASTLVIDPMARPNGTAAPTNPVSSTGGSSIGGATGTTYYLTDTPTGATYAPPIADHAVRDTVTASGVPDQLQLATPTPPGDGNDKARSYSTDVPPGTDGGLGLAGSSSCAGTAKEAAHLWVTPVLNASSAVTATGNAAVSLPTSTWNHAATPGKLCIGVYSIALDASNHATSSTLLGSYSYSLPLWPPDTDLVAFPFRYLATGSTASLAAGRRLGMRLTVDSASSSGLTVVYDHPNFPASVQLETQ